MKKFFSLLLCIALIFSISACNNKSNQVPPADGGTEQTDTGDKNSETNNNDTSSDPKAISTVSSWNDDGVLKILTIGNSFSGNTLEYVYEIATACGVEKVYLGNLHIGGCSLNTHAANARGDNGAYTYYYNRNDTWMHANNYRMSAVITRENWDFISLQQTSPVSGKADTYGGLEYLINYVKSIANEYAKLIWNMTWAYQKDYSGLSNYKNDEISRQDHMYKKIVETVE